MKLYKFFLAIQIIVTSMMLASCEDRLDYGTEIIGDGEALVEATLEFKPSVTQLGSRTPGDAISDIDWLSVVIYDSEKTLFKVVNNVPFTAKGTTTETPGDYPTGDNMDKSESETKTASFNLNLPYGRYYIFAVANLSDENGKRRDLTEDEVDTIEKLKAISCEWDPENIARNAQMFGYFTNSGKTDGANTAFSKENPSVILNQPKIELHSWVRRLASKVTVAFDGSQLNNGVHVYIKSVTLKNIPKSCYLGDTNTPKGSANFYNPIENFLGAHLEEGTTQNDDVVANSRLFYSKAIEGTSDDSGDEPDPGTEYTNWMKVINSGGTDGLYGSTHSETANALYFYENDQHDPKYEGDPKYDKRQYKDNVGTNITDPNQPDYRDAVPDGTYVEVQAYYVSNNPDNYTRGPIRYRFMLGKDVIDNYDAERNHHFKLTLGFKGWANEPDWHIEYDNPEPNLLVPETFRVSYVYNQSHTLPIRVSGFCTGVEMEITKNYWAPCDDNGNTASAGSTNDNDPYAFRWARSVFNQQQTENKDLYNCTGFLALQVENDANGVIPTNILSNYQFQDRGDAVDALYAYYTGNSTAPDQHKRTFSAEKNELTVGDHDGPQGPANNYKVISNGSNDVTLLVPVFTRNKSMIMGTNYSGNNPFEEYDRYAEIKVTAHFENADDEVRTIKVLQTRRLVNPKGIWRRHTNETGTAFHVRLATKSIGASYADNYIQLREEDEWTAYIEPTEGTGFFKLQKGDGNPTDYTVFDDNGNVSQNGKGTKIVGNTGSLIDFYVDFGEGTASTLSNCGIITVLYHNNNCVHKIMVRQGYNEPMAVMGEKPLWSSFSVFGATPRGNSTTEFDVELTQNPLALGSMIRRGRVDQAILVSNNGGVSVSATDFNSFPDPFGAYKPVDYNKRLQLYSPSADQEKWNYWGCSDQPGIGYVNDKGTTSSMGTFYATVNNQKRQYRVPTFEDFKTLDDAEYAYGICYGGGASETQLNPADAFGFIDPENDDEGTEMGMRGIFVYNPDNANQIFFPIGKYGIGRRRMFNISSSNKPQTIKPNYNARSWYGTLWYGDTNKPLVMNKNSTDENEVNNWYRPMAYNVCYQQGAIYWIDKWVSKDITGTGSGCLGWDMNYYGFDFSPYTDNNWEDACIIKLVVDE